jgi:hypothetical protein
MRENMPVLRGIAPFRSSYTLQKKQIKEQKYVSFMRHRTIQIVFHPAKVANKCAKICQFFTRHRTIQIVFHPAKEANKCAKICQWCAASHHSDRLPPVLRIRIRDPVPF